MSRQDVGSDKADTNLRAAFFAITSFLLLAVDQALHQGVESRLTNAQDLFPDLKIVGARLDNDADVKHDAQVDRDSLEPLDAAVVSQGVLVRVASDVLGLAGVSQRPEMDEQKIMKSSGRSCSKCWCRFHVPWTFDRRGIVHSSFDIFSIKTSRSIIAIWITPLMGASCCEHCSMTARKEI
jgi:hypothetical protein